MKKVYIAGETTPLPYPISATDEHITTVLDRLSEEPDHFMSNQNRFQARLINALRFQEVPDRKIYLALFDALLHHQPKESNDD